MVISTYREQACHVLEECIKNGKKIIIYPFGERGRQVKKILNSEFGIDEICIVDNNYIGEVPVIRCSEISDYFQKNVVVLLCCEAFEVKKQIRASLGGYPDLPVIDVFPDDKLYILNWEQIDLSDLQKDVSSLLHEELRRLVFDRDVSVYTTVKKYKNMELLKRFEAYLAQYAANKSIQRAYSLLLYIITKDICVDKGDFLAGRASYRTINHTYPAGVYEELYRLEKAKRIDETESRFIKDAWDMRLFTRFPGGHVVPGYDRILKKGIGEYLSELEGRYAFAKKCCDTEKCNFYESEIVAIRGLQELLIRYARAAEENLNESEMYGRIKRNCEYISFEKPRSFEQALQLLWIMHEVMIAEGNIKGISLGRMDQYLYPFYEQDISKCLLSQTEAYQLILCLWKKFDFDRQALAFQNVTIGDGDNPLTGLILRVQMETRANQPMLSLRVNRDTSDAVWDMAMELIATGAGVPALFNDECIVDSKINAGIRKNDAVNYSIVGCVEQTIGGKEYSHTEGLRLSAAKLLELMMFQGTCPVTGKKYQLASSCNLNDFSSFEEFYNQYKYELQFLIHRSCRMLNQADISYGRNWPAPYLSLFMDGCLEIGKDAADGGTIYNNLSVNFAGLANVVNSLFAIKKIVFEQKKVSLSQVPEILARDFAGHEDIKNQIDELPKYGNNNIEVDTYMRDLTEYIVSETDRWITHKNGKFQAGFYTVTLHAEMGKYMLATFDGRRKGTALANSLSPVQGTDIRGPLAVFHSVTKTPMKKMSNGMVLDLKFVPEFFRGEKREKIKMAIMAYFDMGGMEVQFNVVDQDTLLQAQKHPEKYKNLLVRVSGFSTYFVELDKVLQDEIITRYSHSNI